MGGCRTLQGAGTAELPVYQQCLRNGMGPRRFELLTSAV